MAALLPSLGLSIHLQHTQLLHVKCSLIRPTRCTTSPAAVVPSQRPALLRHRSQTVSARSAAEQQTESTTQEGNFVKALAPDDLPKGTRKEVRIQGQNVLLFWYRSEIFAIEGRSPAEGAYSEGFIAAKLNQDYCIECPSTGTLFDLRSGGIKSWYPSNPVLRLLTPQDTCRNLNVYPVKLTADAIEVDVTAAQAAAATRGGAEIAATKQDVQSIEPREFFQGSEQDTQAGSSEEGTRLGQAFTAIVAAVGIVSLAVAGTAVAIYKDNFYGLVLFWTVFVLGSALYAYSLFDNTPKPK